VGNKSSNDKNCLKNETILSIKTLPINAFETKSSQSARTPPIFFIIEVGFGALSSADTNLDSKTSLNKILIIFL